VKSPVVSLDEYRRERDPIDYAIAQATAQNARLRALGGAPAPVTPIGARRSPIDNALVDLRGLIQECDERLAAAPLHPTAPGSDS